MDDLHGLDWIGDADAMRRELELWGLAVGINPLPWDSPIVWKDVVDDRQKGQELA